jgi:hypothetical protein
MREISYVEAKALKVRKYFTGKPCKHGHTAEYWTSNRTCVVCHQTKTAARALLNPEKQLGYRRNHRARKAEAKPWYELLGGAKVRSEKLGLEYDLDEAWAASRWDGRCALTGIELVRGKKHLGPLSPTIDRIRPELGYTKSNCRFVCLAVNSFKNSGPESLMYDLAERLIANRKQPPEKSDTLRSIE